MTEWRTCRSLGWLEILGRMAWGKRRGQRKVCVCVCVCFLLVWAWRWWLKVKGRYYKPHWPFCAHTQRRKRVGLRAKLEFLPYRGITSPAFNPKILTISWLNPSSHKFHATLHFAQGDQNSQLIHFSLSKDLYT